MNLPSWSIEGIVTDKRELKTKKDEVWAYAISITAMGGVFSCRTKNKKLYERAGEGEQIVANGTFELYQGNPQLQLMTLGSPIEEFDSQHRPSAVVSPKIA
jgi:hypothetical protein